MIGVRSIRIVSLIISFLFILSYSGTFSQTINGIIQDESSGEKLFGAAILVKGTDNGTTTDFEGKFTLKLKEATFPVILVVSYVGFVKKEVPVENARPDVRIRLEPEDIVLESVNIIEDRITEKQRESAVTVESMDAIAVKETPAVNFYDGLGHLKGVDLTAASMGFKVVNTRGFNSTRPVRSLQIIDGVDNQAPGLNFSVGNFAGVSELDIQRVELIVGANSALYGPNAFNGVISMETKSPFIHQGLSVMGKVGERNLRETAFRFARAHKIFGVKEANIAYKLNFSYMEAYDWVANNMDPTEQSEVGVNNPGGYDAVNRYGDENLLPGQNDYSGTRGRLLSPGLGIYHRTGYEEVDLVDYDTRNMKISPSLHYRFKNESVVKLTYNYGTGTTVYQGDNRYSLKGLQMHQFIAEYGKKDKFFVRAYRTQEDAGESYDAVFTALLLQNAVKSNNDWSQDYANYWNRNYVRDIQALEDYPDPNNPMYTPLWFNDTTRPYVYALVDQILAENNEIVEEYHNNARQFADYNGYINKNKRYDPGTTEFDSAFQAITSNKTYLEGGSGFFDQSAMNHIQAEYKLDKNELGLKHLTLLLGGSYRLYQPYSQGTVFLDTGNTRITNWEYGFYASLQYRFFDERLIATMTGRRDKNQNFEPVYSPAFSIVYDTKIDQTFRLSYSSALRNPTLQDQYLYYNIGRAILVGNLNGFEDLVTVPSFYAAYSGQFFEEDSLEYFSIDPVKPEQVRSIEVGYKGKIFQRLFVDMSYYFSRYTNFLGYKIGADIDIDTVNNLATVDQVYRVSANAADVVTTMGYSVGLNFYFLKYLALNGNYSWNILDDQSVDNELIPAFNTPEHKFNVGVSGRNVELRFGKMRIKNFGFNMNYKWIQGFLFEGSPQFTGEIPSYDMIDAQVSYFAPKMHTTFKLGASNILNRMNFQTYGGPRIGRMAYFSVLVELDRKS